MAPASDFYKKLALDLSSQQIAVDLFAFSSQFIDLSTICKLSLPPLFYFDYSWMMEYILSLHLFLYHFNFTVFYQPSNKGVYHFAFFVATWFEERTNQLYPPL